MTLLELLARELKEWPKKADWAVCIRGNGFKASFGIGPHPKPDSSDRENHTWSILGSGKEAHWSMIHRSLSCEPNDRLTDIVTRAQWEAEKSRITGKETWLRHRGRKCPVQSGTLVDLKLRGGVIHRSKFCDNHAWIHTGKPFDVMYYRISETDEQPAIELESGAEISYSPGESLVSMVPTDTILEIRDRIRYLDTQRAELEATYRLQIGEIDGERLELVGKLKAEGLALVGVPVKPVKDMSDWWNWKVGDLLSYAKDSFGLYVNGDRYAIQSIKGERLVIDDKTGDKDHKWDSDVAQSSFKWHSRPAS